MDQENYVFSGTTMLITHYNRSASLERLLEAFRLLQCSFEEIIVSDDGSNREHIGKLEVLRARYNFRLLTTPENRGLANNMNKGQEAVITPYVLYVQEDFIPSSIFPAHFRDALEIMNNDRTVDYIRFWSFFPYPDLRPYGKGFSRTVFRFWNPDHLKFFQYSDNPHLRRSGFLEKFGRYREQIKGDIAEYMMAISFLQHKGVGLFYDDCTSLFTHDNPHDEPSTQGRAGWRQSRNPVFLFLRFFYLRLKWAKCMLDVKFMRV